MPRSGISACVSGKGSSLGSSPVSTANGEGGGGGYWISRTPNPAKPPSTLLVPSRILRPSFGQQLASVPKNLRPRDCPPIPVGPARSVAEVQIDVHVAMCVWVPRYQSQSQSCPNCEVQLLHDPTKLQPCVHCPGLAARPPRVARGGRGSRRGCADRDTDMPLLPIAPCPRPAVLWGPPFARHERRSALEGKGG